MLTTLWKEKTTEQLGGRSGIRVEDTRAKLHYWMVFGTHENIDAMMDAVKEVGYPVNPDSVRRMLADIAGS